MSAGWIVLALALGSSASAPVPERTAPAVELESGEELFRRGVAAYDGRDYASAIAWFRRAYAKDAEPAILFNIAQAQRALGDCRGALENVESFLNAARPDDPLVGRAQKKRDELKTCAGSAEGRGREEVAQLAPRGSQSPPPASAPLVPRSGPPRLELLAAPAPRDREPFFRGSTATACAISTGGTLAFGLTALGFTLAASSYASRVDGATMWTPEVEADDAQGRAFGKAATITAIAAGAAALVAGTSCWLRWREFHAGAAKD